LKKTNLICLWKNLTFKYLDPKSKKALKCPYLTLQGFLTKSFRPFISKMQVCPGTKCEKIKI